MALAKYLEDILDRYVDEAFSSNASGVSVDELRLSVRDVRHRLKPMFDAIARELDRPEAEHFARASKAEWATHRAQAELHRAEAELVNLRAKLETLQREVNDRDGKLIKVTEKLSTAEFKLTRIALDTTLQVEAIKRQYDEKRSRFLRDNNALVKKNDQLSQRVLELEVTQKRQAEEIRSLEQKVLQALVDR